MRWGKFQNLTYSYDPVGNITSRKNTDFSTTDSTAKTSEQTYSYDNMHRLTDAQGTYGKESWLPFNTTRDNTYTNHFEYDSIGNILKKVQTNQATYADTGKTVTLDETTYTLNYTYGQRPHAVTNDGTMTYSYDLNGNMITRTDTSTKLTRNMTWDEENRLTKVSDATITEFKYDDAGIRIIKKGNAGEVVYVNQNYTVRDGSLITKHVFAGNTRVASKVISGEAGGTYYYHADHLGSSSVVTAKDGSYHESLEYFPYGETWIQEKGTGTTGFTTPYKFTSKELDPETNLYYYGARYYDARLSRWTAADPPLTQGKYFPKPEDFDTDHNYMWRGEHDERGKLHGMGGVFNTVNLDVYHYAGNNPVRFIDPDGNIVEKDGYFLPFPAGTDVRVGDGFGLRMLNGKPDDHKGVDVWSNFGNHALRRSTLITAAGDGIVTFVGEKSGYGKTVEISHGYDKNRNEVKTRYGHLNKTLVNKGSEVNTDDRVGYMGTTGNSNGEHLHYEVFIVDKKTGQERQIDPKALLMKDFVQKKHNDK